ncbi:MAG: type I glutamate--ammonia ligase [Nanoarchaeota archaeon]|nr:type I glutamate--ammonia ligase [Nanoarchaeota archaeon]
MKEFLKRVKEDKVEWVKFQFSDFHGFVKSFEKPVSKLEEALKDGLWFDGSSVEGVSRICESDMFLIPDTSTYAKIPWKKNVARLYCDIHTPDGKPFEGDPRYILKKAIKKAKKLGYEYYTGPELEFFLLKKDENGNLIPHDKGGYFDLTLDQADEIRREIQQAIEDFGLSVDMGHHEVAPGQHEINFDYDRALKTADNVLTMKYVVKEIAKKYDLIATFMPKPIFGENGSGMHIHQSLFKDGKNAFFDKKDEYNLSDIAYNFIAGQLEHAKGLAAIVAPTVNSYKRLVPGYEAPVYICWGQVNRSALIRIPRYKKGKEKATRVELRCPDPSANPYLAFAAMLSAGLDGMKNELTPPNPIEDDVYHFDEKERKKNGICHLPYSLMDAIKELKKDEVIKKALGPDLFDKYVCAKIKEWDEFRVQVTEWEKEKYLENY